jgi:1-acyl-sn-glycerol-3-phosphate acyltransferase
MSAGRLSRRSRFLKNLADLAMRLLYRSVEVHQQFGETARGPQLGVANHFGGLSDALILIYALDRVPRFIARDVIWKYPIARQVMNFVGAIPVHKPDDSAGRGAARNDQMFASTYDALEEEDLVVIFPEGITVDDPSIAPIKTGAARIALGARARGVTGIEIVPSGIHYEDKALLRSKVYVHVGDPIDVDAWVEEHSRPGDPQDSSNRQLVIELTSEIEISLRRAAPNFESWREARSLQQASAVALRSPPDAPAQVDYGDQAALADALATRPAPSKEQITSALDTYVADLDAAGLSDEQMMTRQRSRGSFLWRVAWNGLIGLLLLPFAIVGLVINIVPMLGVWLVGKARVDPAMMATLKPGAAIVMFAVTWGIAAWAGWRWQGLAGVGAVLLLMPLYLYAVVALAERGTLVVRALRGRVRTQDLHDGVLEHRNEVVEAVVEAI